MPNMRRCAGVSEPVSMSNGIVMGGGTPGHRWLEISPAGNPIGGKVLVASEEESALNWKVWPGTWASPVTCWTSYALKFGPIPTMFPAYRQT